jgi:hypothetical protein
VIPYGECGEAAQWFAADCQAFDECPRFWRLPITDAFFGYRGIAISG